MFRQSKIKSPSSLSPCIYEPPPLAVIQCFGLFREPALLFQRLSHANAFRARPKAVAEAR
eukprot:595830-Pleurochrysis_carterae.AAC.1